MKEKGKEKQLAIKEQRQENGTFGNKPISCSEQEIGQEPHDSLKIVAEQIGVSDKTLWEWEKITEKA